MERVKIIEIIQLIVIIFLIVFGLFIFYQIVKKILGGSWETEDIIVALLVLDITFTFTIALNQIKYNVDYNYFKKNMHSLAKDFKEHVSLNDREID